MSQDSDLIIAGASGFLGRNFLLRFFEEYDHILAIYNQSPDFLDFIEYFKLNNVFTIKTDLSNTDFTEFEKKLKPMDCLYLAGNSDPTLSYEFPEIDLQFNCFSLVKFLQKVPCRNVVYLSSGAVYHGHVGLVGPTTPISPTLPYAISKMASECYVRYFQEKGTINSFVIVRFFGAYGPWEPSRKIFTRLISALSSKKNPTITIRGDGENLIDAMYVDDAIRALYMIMKSNPDNTTVDLCSGLPTTVNDLVLEVSKIFDRKPSIIHTGRTVEPIQFFPSPEGMKTKYGFAPVVPLDQGITKLNDFLMNKERY